MMAVALDNTRRQELAQVAAAIVADGKGILAADESTGTIGKRFASINLDNTEENRRAYRELLFTASTNELSEYLGGVILFEETLNQCTTDGTTFPELLSNSGIIVGIKVDKGTTEIPGTNGETVTQGLDKLDERCREYYAKGARFAKWRSVIRINQQLGQPSTLAIQENADCLARYAATCQANRLVPIIEPEVLMDGDHDLPYAQHVTEHVLAEVYKKLHDHHVFLEGTLLKPNMVCPGQEHHGSNQCTADDIAQATLAALRRTVPAAVPGITFLSGGQSEDEATANLCAINRQPGAKPWKLSFSYGRALQHSVLKSWKGMEGNRKEAQKILLARAKSNRDAALGRPGTVAGKTAAHMSTATTSESTFVKGYNY